MSDEPLAVVFPESIVEAIAHRSADIVLSRLAHRDETSQGARHRIGELAVLSTPRKFPLSSAASEH